MAGDSADDASGALPWHKTSWSKKAAAYQLEIDGGTSVRLTKDAVRALNATRRVQAPIEQPVTKQGSVILVQWRRPLSYAGAFSFVQNRLNKVGIKRSSAYIALGCKRA